MSFVIYDIETTGLHKRFDQILQFAAVRTDADLVVKDRFEVRIRLMPHIVPSPVALHLNGTDIADVLSSSLPSHYEAVCGIAARLCAWSPTVFLGYNSIQFDEEFLRQALYLCLHPPFLTNTNRNARADVLNVVRAVAALEPDALQIPEEDGRPCFRLAEIARANGYEGGPAHDAANDVDATLHMCRLVAERASELWSRFLRFAQRRVASEFVADEEAFVYFDQVGSFHSTHIVTSLGASPTHPALHFCADLKADLDALGALDTASLAEAVVAQPRPIRRLRLNAAPLLIPLYEATADLLEGKSEEDYLSRARALHQNQPFVSRLKNAALAGERVFADSPHVEEQIYSDDFPTDEEKALLQQFHAVEWPARRDIARRFVDGRYRTIATRLFYLERPDLLLENHKKRILAGMEQRRRGEAQQQPSCRTVREAQAELNSLLLEDIGENERRRLQELAHYYKSLL